MPLRQLLKEWLMSLENKPGDWRNRLPADGITPEMLSTYDAVYRGQVRFCPSLQRLPLCLWDHDTRPSAHLLGYWLLLRATWHENLAKLDDGIWNLDNVRMRPETGEVKTHMRHWRAGLRQLGLLHSSAHKGNLTLHTLMTYPLLQVDGRPGVDAEMEDVLKQVTALEVKTAEQAKKFYGPDKRHGYLGQKLFDPLIPGKHWAATARDPWVSLLDIREFVAQAGLIDSWGQLKKVLAAIGYWADAQVRVPHTETVTKRMLRDTYGFSYAVQDLWEQWGWSTTSQNRNRCRNFVTIMGCSARGSIGTPLQSFAEKTAEQLNTEAEAEKDSAVELPGNGEAIISIAY